MNARRQLEVLVPNITGFSWQCFLVMLCVCPGEEKYCTAHLFLTNIYEIDHI